MVVGWDGLGGMSIRQTPTTRTRSLAGREAGKVGASHAGTPTMLIRRSQVSSAALAGSVAAMHNTLYSEPLLQNSAK